MTLKNKDQAHMTEDTDTKKYCSDSMAVWLFKFYHQKMNLMVDIQNT